MVALRPNHQIHHRLAPHNFFAFRLRHASRHAYFQIRLFIFQRFETTKLRIDFFSGFLANMASIQQDHIRIIRRFGLNIARAAQGLYHTLAIVDIHLTAIGFYEQFFWRAHCLAL